MENKNTVLNIENLTVEYHVDGEVSKAATNVSLHLDEGTTLGLVGETGAGKTTTALAALNLIQCPPGVVTADKIEVCGKDMQKLSQRELEKVRGKDISMIFQDPMTSLNPVFDVGTQIQEAILMHEKLSRADAWEKAMQMLELVGIPRERGREYPHQFSGGMKQRVVIAIALACTPKILIADEPTTALDVTIQAQVLEMMKELRNKYGTAMIMITHDLGIVAESCDYVAVMYAGRIIEYGTLDEIFNNTRHPYTEGLFNSLPNINNRVGKLKPIPGMMPDPRALPEGCAFADRCRYATEACRQKTPDTIQVNADHTVACCRYNEPGFIIERSKAQ